MASSDSTSDAPSADELPRPRVIWSLFAISRDIDESIHGLQDDYDTIDPDYFNERARPFQFVHFVLRD